MWRCVVLCGAVKCGAVWCCDVWCRDVWCCVVLCCAVMASTTHCSFPDPVGCLLGQSRTSHLPLLPAAVSHRATPRSEQCSRCTQAPGDLAVLPSHPHPPAGKKKTHTREGWPKCLLSSVAVPGPHRIAGGYRAQRRGLLLWVGSTVGWRRGGGRDSEVQCAQQDQQQT